MEARHRKHRPLALYAFAVAALTIAGCQTTTNLEADQTTASASAAAMEPEKPPERFPKPETVRGIYLTAWVAGGSDSLTARLELVGRTELNAVVIDVRDAGWNYWKNDVARSAAAGANKIAIANGARVMDRVQEFGVYPIARIACFRDRPVPEKFPQYAIQNASTGKPWKDTGGYTWLDPYNKDNWEYIASFVDLALDHGFPEIQLDYVRFPSEGRVSTMSFPAKKSYPNPEATPTEVIAAFGQFIRERVKKRGAILSADIFGIVSSGSGDQGIGQALETVVEPFDLVCPMVYPSHYAKGEYGIKDPNRSPYEIVLKSLSDYRRRLPDKHIRPWLQDFSLYGVPYGKAEVQAQIKAAKECGYEEYLLWNAQTKYTESAVVDTSHLSPKPKPVPTPSTQASSP